MIEFEHLHHVSLAVRELERSRVFYTQVLGLQEIARPPFTSKGLWYAVGTQQLHLLENPTGETLRESGINTVDGHFAIWVKSYSGTVAWLEAASVPYEARPDSVAGFAQIYVLDPDLNVIEFDAPYGS
ncbi:Glyoxalase-like domain-containing protein [Paenibacillus sp. UNCCL117]|uniref:VOC family protein n=1 Tax=unclassified Paenibacillus TaxID=185978 RepID=UPI00088FB658|nr:MULTISPECIES: VOC family protein [unclassified Paenibacillus]SDD31263.1 Glyoxalase-like domain-containing protein [Paenibacillus sp. cl123]SFW40162.1 Glyoxalase-like domain-containing protein [Paenibacillus sp. UNCCL117]